MPTQYPRLTPGSACDLWALPGIQDLAPHRGRQPEGQARPASSLHNPPQAEWGWVCCAIGVPACAFHPQSRWGAGWGSLTCLLAEPRDTTCLPRLQVASRLLD